MEAANENLPSGERQAVPVAVRIRPSARGDSFAFAPGVLEAPRQHATRPPVCGAFIGVVTKALGRVQQIHRYRDAAASERLQRLAELARAGGSAEWRRHTTVSRARPQ